MNIPNPNKIALLVSTVALVAIGYFLIWWQKDIEIAGQPGKEQTSSITGLACKHVQRRPVAVMLASDPVARPLSGISRADMVFEMPVTPNGVTRLVAVFQCEEPSEIGSIRSARLDFLPLMESLNAIYIHWGGEKEALALLDANTLDNIDGLKYDGTVFYRKPKVKPPHNGFTTMTRILETAVKLKYSLSDTFDGYPHSTESPRNIANIQHEIVIPYDGPYAVTWKYDEKARTYGRFRDGTPEIDAENRASVSASVVIKMEAVSSVLSQDYISVQVGGEGNATIYQHGVAIGGTWKKDASKPESRLEFYAKDGKELAFAPGKIWVEIVNR